jgi:hypothetical protein
VASFIVGENMPILVKRKSSLPVTKRVLIQPKQTLTEPTVATPEVSERKHLKVRPQEVQEVKSTVVKNIIDYWVKSGLKSLPKEGTKSFKAIVLAITRINRGKFYTDKPELFEYQNSRFTEEQIMMAIDNFALSAKDSTYYPVNKAFIQNITLLQFFYHPYSQYTKSYFLHYLKNEPIKRVEDRNERLTDYLIGLYRTEVLNGTDVDISIKSKEKFIDASAKLKNFFTRNSAKIRNGIGINELKLSRWLYESILEDVKENSKILPGFFCSAETFERRLPIYLINQNIFK